MKKIRRRYTKEFKRQAVALMEDPEKSNEQVAKELEVDISLLYKWRKALELDKSTYQMLPQAPPSVRSSWPS